MMRLTETQLVTGQGGHAAVFDSTRTGRPHSARRDDIAQRVNIIIMADISVALKQLSVQLDAGEGSVCKILEQLGCECHAATDRFAQGTM